MKKGSSKELPFFLKWKANVDLKQPDFQKQNKKIINDPTGDIIYE